MESNKTKRNIQAQILFLISYAASDHSVLLQTVEYTSPYSWYSVQSVVKYSCISVCVDMISQVVLYVGKIQKLSFSIS